MRVQARGLLDVNRDFADFLMRAGNGKIPQRAGGDVIELPAHSRPDATHASPLAVVRKVSPSIDANGGRSGEYYHSRAVLCSKKQPVGAIYRAASTVSPGAGRALHSADFARKSVWESNSANAAGFLNSVYISGAPPHTSGLKVGMPVMLAQNFDPSWGLCDGSRLHVKAIRPRRVEAVMCVGRQ